MLTCTDNSYNERCTVSQILFDKVLYIFRTGPLSIIRSISTLCPSWLR